MRSCREFLAVELLCIGLGVLEKVHNSVVEHLVVAVAQEVGLVDVLRCLAHHVLHVAHRAGGSGLVRGSVDEIEHVSLVEFLSELLCVLLAEGWGQESVVELAGLLVREIGPVLLDVHLVRVECIEIDAVVLVFVKQAVHERGSLIGEIVHLRGVIFKKDHHMVTVLELVGGFAVDSESSGRKDHVGRGISRALEAVAALTAAEVYSVGSFVEDIAQFVDVLRADCDPAGSAESLLFEGESLDILQPDADLALVVGPVDLLPDVHREPSVGEVPPADLVGNPLPGLSGHVPERRSEFQRTQQTELQTLPVLCREIADELYDPDIFILVGSQKTVGSRLRTVLAEKFVEGDGQGSVPVPLSIFADLAQALLHVVETGRDVDFLVRVEQVPELLVACENDRSCGCLNRNGKGGEETQ